MAKKENLKRETDSLLIAAKNNARRTNYIKSKINYTYQNWKCRLCGYRDETVNHVRERNKWSQNNYKIRHDYVGKATHWELCKKFKFDYTIKWYMHKIESIRENETRKYFWDFEIQMCHLIPVS